VIVKEYVDVASGKNGDRQQFKSLFAAASRREFDSVLFWSLDRFSREGVFETLTYLQKLTQYGVGYRSFSEQYLDPC
jgi:DNA invertase Pin-like site-specific DNA recombinase